MTEANDDTVADDVLGRGAPTPQPPASDVAADALEVTTLIEGQGTGAAAGNTLTVHYVGLLPDGTVFDESWSRNEPFPVTLGEGRVIDGWEQGLIGAQAGERRRLVMGPDLAYGSADMGIIPSNSPLAFEVDVLAITS